MSNRFNHQRGSGLFRSCRSSSHKCPMVLGFSDFLRRGSVIQRLSQNMAMIPITTGTMMNQFQKALVKSATFAFSGGIARRRVLIFQRHARRGVEALLAPRAEGPDDDGDEQ